MSAIPNPDLSIDALRRTYAAEGFEITVGSWALIEKAPSEPAHFACVVALHRGEMIEAERLREEIEPIERQMRLGTAQAYLARRVVETIASLKLRIMWFEGNQTR